VSNGTRLISIKRGLRPSNEPSEKREHSEKQKTSGFSQDKVLCEKVPRCRHHVQPATLRPHMPSSVSVRERKGKDAGRKGRGDDKNVENWCKIESGEPNYTVPSRAILPTTVTQKLESEEVVVHRSEGGGEGQAGTE